MEIKSKISIIVTTYNSGKLLQACLNSIKNQTFKNFEVIIVDEDSTDNTQEIVRKYGYKLIVKGKERCQKRNIGAENSRADYLIFIDSDMELSPKLLEECLNYLSSETLIMIPEISFGIGFWAKCKAFERAMYVGGDIAQGVRVYPKKVFLKAHGFDEKMLGIEDLDLFYRIKKQNKKIKVAEIKSFIYHNEGKLTYSQIIKRMSFYSKSFVEYRKRHTPIAKKQLSILRYLKNLGNLIKHPILALGFVMIKLGEGTIVFYALRNADT